MEDEQQWPEKYFYGIRFKLLKSKPLPKMSEERIEFPVTVLFDKIPKYLEIRCRSDFPALQDGKIAFCLETFVQENINHINRVQKELGVTVSYRGGNMKIVDYGSFQYPEFLNTSILKPIEKFE